MKEVKELALVSGEARSRYREQLEQRPKVRVCLACLENSKKAKMVGEKVRGVKRTDHLWPC